MICEVPAKDIEHITPILYMVSSYRAGLTSLGCETPELIFIINSLFYFCFYFCIVLCFSVSSVVTQIRLDNKRI